MASDNRGADGAGAVSASAEAEAAWGNRETEVSDSDSVDGECGTGGSRAPRPCGELFANLFRKPTDRTTQLAGVEGGEAAAQSGAHAAAHSELLPAGGASAQVAAQASAGPVAQAATDPALHPGPQPDQTDRLFLLSTSEPDLSTLEPRAPVEAVRKCVYEWSAARGFSLSQESGGNGKGTAQFLCGSKGRRQRGSDKPHKQQCLPEKSRNRATCVRAVAGEALCPFR
jgi:hypothetical protein